MKKVEFTLEYKMVDRMEELTESDKELLLQARVFCARSYSPYSKFAVGAAARLQSGKIVAGANQENASFPLCICAEQAVLSNCGSNHPNDPIVQLAVSAKSQIRPVEKPVSPCGACRQSILEYEIRQSQPIQIFLQGESGPIYIIDGVKNLLPLSFNGGDL